MKRASPYLTLVGLTLVGVLLANQVVASPPAAIAAEENNATYRAIEWGVALLEMSEHNEGMERIVRSAEADNPHARFLVGLLGIKAGECAIAADHLQRAHERGHLHAGGALRHYECDQKPLVSHLDVRPSTIAPAELQRRQRDLLARDTRYPRRFHYEMGQLLASDFDGWYGATAEATRWLDFAVKADHVGAQVLLGKLLVMKPNDPSGKQPHRPKEGEYWLRRAAATGDGWAIYSLSRMLHFENIATSNPREALQLVVELAKSKDNPLAGYFAGVILASHDNNKRAESWFRFAAERNHPRAALSLAGLLLDSSPNRKREGLDLIEREADRGNAEAQFRLGTMYQFGRHVEVNHTRACRYYHDAAESGHGSSMNNLANCYEEGKGAPRDYKKAYKLYQLAHKQGSAFALYSIGGMHERGLGFPASLKTAIKYYQRAADLGVDEAVKRLTTLRKAGTGVPAAISPHPPRQPQDES